MKKMIKTEESIAKQHDKNTVRYKIPLEVEYEGHMLSQYEEVRGYLQGLKHGKAVNTAFIEEDFFDSEHFVANLLFYDDSPKRWLIVRFIRERFKGEVIRPLELKITTTIEEIDNPLNTKRTAHV